VKIGIDLDDVMAICSVPYLRRFAQAFNVELPDESQIGWHLLSQKERGAGYDTVVPGLDKVTLEQRDQFRIRLYDSTFFAELHLTRNGRAHTVSSRPSDAIALAVRTGTPIFAEETVLAEAAWPSKAAE